MRSAFERTLLLELLSVALANGAMFQVLYNDTTVPTGSVVVSIVLRLASICLFG